MKFINLWILNECNHYFFGCFDHDNYQLIKTEALIRIVPIGIYGTLLLVFPPVDPVFVEVCYDEREVGGKNWEDNPELL